MVLDLDKSQGRRLWDARSGRWILDMFSFFATLPVGLNHPRLKDPEFLARLQRAALANPANSDIYTIEMAEFVDTFGRVAQPGYLPHAFFVAGGALGVENALKAAFDWKVRRNFRAGAPRGEGPPGPALPRGLPRPHRLHALDDQHRRPAQAPVLPEVRLAAHRQSRSCASRWTPPRPRAWQQAEAAALAQVKAAFRERRRRHRLRDHRAHPGRGRRQPLPRRVPAGAARPGPRERRAVRRGRGAERRRPDRPHVGAPALRRRARPARLRQEDAGLRHDGRPAHRRGARERLQGLEPAQLDLGRQPGGHGARPALPRDHRGGEAGRARRHRVGAAPAAGARGAGRLAARRAVERARPRPDVRDRVRQPAALRDAVQEQAYEDWADDPGLRAGEPALPPAARHHRRRRWTRRSAIIKQAVEKTPKP